MCTVVYNINISFFLFLTKELANRVSFDASVPEVPEDIALYPGKHVE